MVISNLEMLTFDIFILLKKKKNEFLLELNIPVNEQYRFNIKSL